VKDNASVPSVVLLLLVVSIGAGSSDDAMVFCRLVGGTVVVVDAEMFVGVLRVCSCFLG
jgi:hypothetical protein